MRKFTTTVLCVLVALMLVVGVGMATPAPSPQSAPALQAGQEGCLNCHAGIEDIRQQQTGMMVQIMAIGECTACHGGDPAVLDDAEAAHGPEGAFYPDPGSPWVVDKTCGRCHIGYGDALRLSLMNTEAGKIQGNLWAWGIQGDYSEGMAVRYANYTLDDEDGPVPAFGTETYKTYMQALIEQYPDQMPAHVDMLPSPSVDEIAADPSLAVFTYLRNQCQRCHVSVPGRSRRGDYRGMGCSACHIPYGNDGFYEGNDPTIPKDAPGKLLVHEMQAGREARDGVPVETCNSCHNRGKRIGVSFEGIMEFPYGTPFFADGGRQDSNALHTKKYLYIKDDLHHDPISREGNPEGGMLCQDCHTGIEMHGDGNLFGTTLAQVEIECSDCHGTPDRYPWELPLGYGEELLKGLGEEARGTTSILPGHMSFGEVYDPEDGYLLTARGNPFGNVVRRGDDVIVHSSSGRDYTVPTLKSIKLASTWKTPDAEVAMDKVAAHQEELECYACHADWAPQCYGCHVLADYSEGKSGTDWVAIGNTQFPDGTVDTSHTTAGKITESRSYLRWEEPILGINGEGRVTPLIPGCQVIYTVIGPQGESLAHNVIGHTPPNTEGAGTEGQRGMDMAPAQPHTVGREARKCESCHSDPKALGYGIDGGRYLLGYDQSRVIDLRDADGNLIPANASAQMATIPDLPMDLSQIVDPKTGQQMMTVGSHWPASGPLSEDQRTHMERTGVCMGCHQNMADTAFWTDGVIAKYGEIVSNDEHINTMNQLVRDAAAGEAPPGPTQSELESAQEQVAAMEEQLSTAEAELSDVQSELDRTRARLDTALATAAEAPAPVTAPNYGLVTLAAALGLAAGAGLLYATRRK